MKQIVVVTSNRKKAEKAFDSSRFYVAWCSMNLEDIIELRTRSNIFFFCIYDDDPDELKRIGIYLRELCIEEEKILYIYGTKEGVDILNSFVPSIYIRKSEYFYNTPIDDLTDDVLLINKLTDKNSKYKSILIMEEDDEYVAQLRLYLDSVFQIFVCNYDLNEMGGLILYSDILLIGTDGRFTIPESVDLLRIVQKRKKATDFHSYFIAKDNAERQKLNIASVSGNISFSKEMEISRIAKYLSELK